jgi:hypothetical protein
MRALLEGLTQLFLAILHAPQPLTQKAHLGPVLFLALYLAARPRGKRAILWGTLGALACIAAQALTTATLLVASDDRRPEMRVLRDLAIAIDKVTPLAAALLLVPRARQPAPPRPSPP